MPWEKKRDPYRVTLIVLLFSSDNLLIKSKVMTPSHYGSLITDCFSPNESFHCFSRNVKLLVHTVPVWCLSWSSRLWPAEQLWLLHLHISLIQNCKHETLRQIWTKNKVCITFTQVSWVIRIKISPSAAWNMRLPQQYSSYIIITYWKRENTYVCLAICFQY